MMQTDTREPDLAPSDLVVVGLLASPGFVLPSLFGPSFETLGLTAITTGVATIWVGRRLLGRRRSGEEAARLGSNSSVP